MKPISSPHLHEFHEYCTCQFNSIEVAIQRKMAHPSGHGAIQSEVYFGPESAPAIVARFYFINALLSIKTRLKTND